jgi:hypothetical protein
MAGLDLFGTGDDQEQDGVLGGLGVASKRPDLLTTIALLDRENFSQQPQPNNPSGLLDMFRGLYTGILPTAEQHKRAAAQWEQAASAAQDPKTKWLQFASGMLSPTKTGSFGESLGYGTRGLAQGIEQEHKVGTQLAQQRLANLYGTEHLGLQGAQLDATLQALSGRLMSPEAKKSASRADLSGKPRGSPEWQAVFEGEMNKAKFFSNLTPDMKQHVASNGNPDEMTLPQMQALVKARQTKLDTQKDAEVGLKTNPLFQYGVTDPTIFDNLEGDDLKNAIASHPNLAAAVNGLVSGNITEAQLRAGRSSSGTVPYLTNLAMRLDPGYSTARNKLVNDYKSSKEGSTGAKMNAINTAIGHIGSLSTLGDALKNHDLQAGNKILNTILSQFGKAPVNNYELAQQAVGEELMRVFRQAGASEREASAWGARFSSANSPEKIQDAARTAVELLRSRMDPLNETWKREFHQDYPILTDKSKGIVAMLAKSAPQQTGNAWLDAAIAHNPGMSKEDIIAEGKKRGKIPQDFQ